MENRTFSNKVKQKSKKTLNTLNAFEMAAVLGRYYGKSYKVIAWELNKAFSNSLNKNFSNQLLRHWFMKKGRLYEAYSDFVLRQNIAGKHGREGYVNSIVLDAVLTINEIVKNPEHPKSLRAAMVVINRVWGTSAQHYKESQRQKLLKEQELALKEQQEHQWDNWTVEQMEEYAKQLDEEILRHKLNEVREALKEKKD